MKKIIITTILFTSPFNGLYAMDYNQLETVFGEPVTMGATGIPQRASEVPVTMDIITSEDIEKSGAKDVPQLLMHLPGVQVQRGYIDHPTVAIRGYARPNNNRVLILLDGTSINLPTSGQANWNNLPVTLDEIQQIEVIKGPNSSIYGFSAQTGVINIVTKNPMYNKLSHIKLRTGTQQHQYAEFAHTAQFEKHATRMAGVSMHSNGFKNDDDINTDNQSQNQKLSIDHVREITPASNLRIQATYSDETSDKFSVYATHLYSQFKDRHLNLSYEKDYGNGYLNIKTHLYEGAYQDKSSNSLTGYKVHARSLKIDHFMQLNPKHKVKARADIIYNSVKGPIISNSYDRMDTYTWSPSFLWQYNISPKVKITNSIRYDHVEYGRTADITFGPNANKDAYDRNIEEITYNSSINYIADNKNSYKLSLARGSHIPTLQEIGVGQDLSATGIGYFVGNPNLEPERSTSLEFSYSRNINNDHSLKTNLYYMETENVTNETIDDSGPVDIVSYGNVGSSRLLGLELAYNVNKPLYSWGAYYTYTQTHDSPNANAQMFYEDAQPKHQISFNGSINHKKWTFAGDVNYISRADQTFLNLIDKSTPDTEQIDDYVVLNANASYQFNKNLKLSIHAYNLIDDHDEWYKKPSTIDYIKGASIIRQSVLATMQYKF